MITEVVPWVTVQSTCSEFGMGWGTAKNKICAGTFPVPTYKVGRQHVIDRLVYEQYFRAKSVAHLLAMKYNK